MTKKKKKKKRDYRHVVMFQKAKTIKKTIKTEVKAMVHGQERVDKRGKPVTSIADRTNVRASSYNFSFFLFTFFVVGSGFTRLLSRRKMPSFLCVLLPREENARAQKGFLTPFERDTKRPKQEEILFTTTTTIIIIIIIIIVLTPRVFSFFLLFTGVRFEISRAERVRGTGKRVRESVQQRPLPAEGKTHANAAVSVRRRPGQPSRSGVRVRY